MIGSGRNLVAMQNAISMATDAVVADDITGHLIIERR